MPYLTIAVATPVRRPKQSERLAATLYSPPETWTSNERALRNGMTPGSSRWTSAPRERKSNAHGSVRSFKPFMDAPGHRRSKKRGRLHDNLVVRPETAIGRGGIQGRWE